MVAHERAISFANATEMALVDGSTRTIGIKRDSFSDPYRWVAGLAGGSLLDARTPSPGGRWERMLPHVVLHPFGDGTDDWPTLMAALELYAYKAAVVLAPGTWYCKSKQVTPSGTTLILGPGVYVVMDLTPTAHVLDATAFYNSGGTGAGDFTDLADDAVVGSSTIEVVDVTVGDVTLAVGDFINLRNGLIRRMVYQVKEVGDVGDGPNGGTEIVLDRPVLRPYPSTTSTIAIVDPGRDIRIFGDGAHFSGTGDNISQFASGWNVVISDIDASVNLAFYTASIDVGSYRCHNVDWIVDGNDVTPYGMCLFNSEDCSATAKTMRMANGGWFAGGCDNARMRGTDSESGVVGLTVTVDSDEVVGADLGCLDCDFDLVIRSSVSHGAMILNGSSGNDVRVRAYDCGGSAVYLDDGATAVSPSNNNISGSSKRCVGGSVHDASGATNVVTKWESDDDGGGSGAHQFIAAAGSTLDVIDVAIRDTGKLSTGDGLLAAVGAGSVMRVQSARATSTRSSGTVTMLQLASAGGRMDVRGIVEFDAPSATVGTVGVLCTDGVVNVAGFRHVGNAGAQDVGLLAIGASARINVGPGVDVGDCTTPVSVSGGGVVFRGPNAVNGTGALTEYADNAAALAGGLIAGDHYTTTGAVKVAT